MFIRFAIAAAFVGCTIPCAHASRILRTNESIVVHWEDETVLVGLSKNQRPQTLSVPSAEQALREASKAWNVLQEMGPRFEMESDVPRLSWQAAPPVAVEVVFCRDQWRGTKGLLAETRFSADARTGVVTTAVVEVNECDHRFVGPDEVAPDHLDLQAVLTHELGHVLGLAHSADTSAVMFQNTGTVQQRRPTLDDREGIARLYNPHLVGALRASVAPPGHAAEQLIRKTNAETPTGTEMPWPEAPAPAASSPSMETSGKAEPETKHQGGRPSPTQTGPVKARKTFRVPENTISAVRLKGDQNLVLYTSEPVILPQIEISPEAPNSRNKNQNKGRKSRRSKTKDAMRTP